MLNISVAKDAFEKYVSKYDMTDPKVKLKYHHTYRVCEQSLNISKSLGLNEEETNLAYVIALLHDIGRFRQEEVYHTFNDLKSIDHALLGCTILFDEGLIKEFVSDEKYYSVIKDAVFNHNKYSIDCEDEHTLQCKIIRDADKIDILHILTYADKKEEWEKEDLSLEKISDKIYTSFMEKNEVIYNQRKTPLDVLVSEFAYIFDFNYKYSLIYIKKEQYIETLYKRFCFKDEETKFRFNNIYEKTKSYIDTVIN